MSQYDYDLIVIGGGAAGLTASTFAAQSGAKTLLLEKEKKLGGDCLHFGCVPSKSLIKSSYVYHVMQHADRYGLPRTQLPPVDFRKVSQRLQRIIGTIQEHDDPEYLRTHYNVETQCGQPQFVDNHMITLNGKKITSRYFILASGSSPFIPPMEGLSQVSYITNQTIFSLEKLPESLIVLGAGPIGMEMAQAFGRLGSRVTVIQSAGQILPKEDPDIAAFVQGYLEKEGVKIYLNTKAILVTKDNGLISVKVEQKEGTRIMQGEVLLVSAGRRANVDGLDLNKAGVAYTPHGVKVDQHLRTTAKNIYACGDVNGGWLFTHVASYEAVIAVFNAIMKIPKKVDFTKVPWCTYLDPEVASIGYNETRARQAGLDFTIQKDYFAHNDRALAESESQGFIKLLINKKGRVIGVQMIGYHAGDLIHEWVPVLNGKISLSTLAEAIHAYPTLAEINKSVSVQYLVSRIPPWIKPITKWIFGYQGKA